MSVDDVQAQINQMQAQIAECLAKIAELQAQLDKLQEIKPKVAEIKTNIETQKKEFKGKIKWSEQWDGRRRKEYWETAKESLISPYDTYCTETEEIKLGIQNAITRIEDEICEQQARMTSLGGCIKSLMLNGMSYGLGNGQE